MRVLALNPFHGGSHRAFLEGWMRHSRHDFTSLTLPDRHWKWRMRQAAISFAEQLRQPPLAEQSWDVLWVTDMLNLAELRGLCGGHVRQLPAVLYFHENQLTYPVQEDETDRNRDLHFGFTNVVSALAADAVWWNSRFHHDTFLSAVDELSRQLPDRTLTSTADTVRAKSSICPPGIDQFPVRPAGVSRSVTHILWAARWEHDKQPAIFFDALNRVADAGLAFDLSVIGQSYREVPDCFAAARRRFGDRIRHWGYLDSRDEYRSVLQSADIFVSTASHEFFGIAAAEAISAGCYPLLPNRVAYPELVEGRQEFLYEGDSEELSRRLAKLITQHQQGLNPGFEALQARQAICRFAWPTVAAEMDRLLEEPTERG